MIGPDHTLLSGFSSSTMHTNGTTITTNHFDDGEEEVCCLNIMLFNLSHKQILYSML